MGFNFGVENLIDANVVSFAVMVGIITWGCKKLKVGELLKKGSLKIKDIVDKSEDAKAHSYGVLKNAQTEMERLPGEIENLHSEAKNTGEILAKQIKEEADKKTKIIEDNMRKNIDFEVKTTTDSLSKDISIASLRVAQDNLKQLLEKDATLHERIINECIEAL